MHLVRSPWIYFPLIALCGLSDCSNITGSAPSVTNHNVPSIFGTAVHSIAPSKAKDLVYIADGVSNLYVYTYPQGKLAEKFTGLYGPAGECVDAKGDVFVTITGSGEILEYAHGGSEVLASLSDPGEPYGCAVDPVTGNLAVTNYYPSTIEIYPHAQGSPTSYSSPYFGGYYYCTYDDSGNLFADGGDQTGVIAELPYGGTTLQPIQLSKNLVTWSMQWDGSDISIIGQLPINARTDHSSNKSGPVQVYRVHVSGSTGTIMSESFLDSPNGKHVNENAQYWIAGKTIIGAGYYREGRAGLLTWRYPRGGHLIHGILTRWIPFGTTP